MCRARHGEGQTPDTLPTASKGVKAMYERWCNVKASLPLTPYETTPRMCVVWIHILPLTWELPSLHITTPTEERGGLLDGTTHVQHRQQLLSMDCLCLAADCLCLPRHIALLSQTILRMCYMTMLLPEECDVVTHTHRQ